MNQLFNRATFGKILKTIFELKGGIANSLESSLITPLNDIVEIVLMPGGALSMNRVTFCPYGLNKNQDNP